MQFKRVPVPYVILGLVHVSQPSWSLAFLLHIIEAIHNCDCSNQLSITMNKILCSQQMIIQTELDVLTWKEVLNIWPTLNKQITKIYTEKSEIAVETSKERVKISVSQGLGTAKERNTIVCFNPFALLTGRNIVTSLCSKQNHASKLTSFSNSIVVQFGPSPNSLTYFPNT